jgi:hypothetical protein
LNLLVSHRHPAVALQIEDIGRAKKCALRDQLMVFASQEPPGSVTNWDAIRFLNLKIDLLIARKNETVRHRPRRA